ncbi:UDP-3-O-(3-hydroxymyristoyl)glucosamine N-acyltransferase [Ectothiorhodospiraceae bacterium BW-2]|nr:UDP-3-O-(3-hydroxymyristoyl)glucosamine N-acyltransferase [Ectothiorhodospiraceae bacterium BW-2]
MPILTLAEVAQQLDAELLGEGALPVDHLAPLNSAAAGALTFCVSAKFRRQLRQNRATAVLLTAELAQDNPNASLIVVDPYLSYARISQRFLPPMPAATIDASAQIAPSARLGEGVAIGPNVVIEEGVELGARCVVGAGGFIGANCRLGDNCHLYPRVTLYRDCKVGRGATIHSGAVIGADGFGFAHHGTGWTKIAQLGGVTLGDEIEIGANTTIDRGAMADTLIGDGVKIDNQVQIAHNVTIGDHTAIAGCVGIAGSATIGRHCAIGGGAGILGHLQICDGVTITATSLVTGSIRQPGVYSSGTPLQPSAEWQKNFVRFKQLNAMAQRLNRLEQLLPPSPPDSEPNQG